MEYGDVLVLTEHELRKLVSLNERTVAQIEQGFAELEKGNAVMPAVMTLQLPDAGGAVDVRSGYVKGLPGIAVKTASGFFSNPDLGLPSCTSQMLLLSAENGLLLAVLLDNGYLTEVRSAAAGAIAAKYMAPRFAETVGVIGSGIQARMQLEALKLERSFKRVYVYSTDSDERTEIFLSDMKKKLKVPVEQAESAEAVVAKSSIVVTTTPSREGYLRPEWVHPGLHITAMGSDSADKQELVPGVLRTADIIACDLRSQCIRIGELRGGIEQGIISDETPIQELGAIILGRQSGRVDEDQVTLCDLTGTGVQDTMIAMLAYELANEKEVGLRIKN